MHSFPFQEPGLSIPKPPLKSLLSPGAVESHRLHSPTASSYYVCVYALLHADACAGQPVRICKPTMCMHICTCIIPICLYVSTYPSMHPPIYKQMQPVSLPPYFVVQDSILATKYPRARPFTCSDQPSQHTTHHLHLMGVALHPRKFIHVLPDIARIGLPGAFPWVYVWTSGQQQRSTSYCHPSPTVL